MTVAHSFGDSFAGIEPDSVPMFVVMQVVGLVIAIRLLSVFICAAVRELTNPH